MRMLVVCLVAVLGMAARAEAQHYEKIRVDFGLVGGYASAIAEGGFGGVVEPKFLVTDNLAAALRVEGMVTFGATVGGSDTSFGTGSVGLIGVKGEYLIGDYAVRPAVGLGLGIYHIGGDTIDSAPDQVIVSHKSGSYLGASPSLAVDLGRVRLAMTYHVIFGADVQVDQMSGGATMRRDFSQSYVTFELSFHVGGTRLSSSATKFSSR